MSYRYALSEWLQRRTLATSHAEPDAETLNCSYIPGEKAKQQSVWKIFGQCGGLTDGPQNEPTAESSEPLKTLPYTTKETLQMCLGQNPELRLSWIILWVQCNITRVLRR